MLEGRLTEIVKTGAESWAERDLHASRIEARSTRRDAVGPVSIAVAGSPAGMALPAAAQGASAEAGKPGEQGIVVVGDSDFGTSQLIGSYRNRDLFVNSVNGLMGDVGAISIRPNESRASRLRQLSAEEFFRIRFLTLFVLPELIAFAGVYAWWSRRRAPGR